MMNNSDIFNDNISSVINSNHSDIVVPQRENNNISKTDFCRPSAGNIPPNEPVGYIQLPLV